MTHELLTFNFRRNLTFSLVCVDQAKILHPVLDITFLEGCKMNWSMSRGDNKDENGLGGGNSWNYSLSNLEKKRVLEISQL